MSEFRVIKCKKCDAALTEIVGETLTDCVQCGYSFNLPDSDNKTPHALSNKTKESSEYKRYLKKIRNKNFNSATFKEKINSSPELANLVNKLRQLNTQKTKQKTGKNLKAKKPLWISIVKWYFIIVFSMGILSQCFYR